METNRVTQDPNTSTMKHLPLFNETNPTSARQIKYSPYQFKGSINIAPNPVPNMEEGQGWGSRIPTVYQTDIIFNFRKASPNSPTDTLYQQNQENSTIYEGSQQTAGTSKPYQKFSYRG